MSASSDIWQGEYEGLLWSERRPAEARPSCPNDAPALPDYVTVAPHWALAARTAEKPAPLAFLE